MVSLSRLAALAASLSLTATIVAGPAVAGQRAKKQQRRAPQPETVAVPIAEDGISRQLWEDDATYWQMSGAARARLDRVFGQKPGRVQPGSVDRPYPLNFANKTAFTNVLVNDPTTDTTNDTQSETSTVAFGTTVVTAFNDSGSNVSGSHFTGYSVSTNGGASFVDKGVLPTTSQGDAGDPVLAHDNTSGALYMSTLGFTSGNILQIFKSIDGGQTFAQGAVSTPGATRRDSMDKEWIAVDNFAGTGQGNIYCFWRNFGGGTTAGGMCFTRSTDGGATWGPTRPWVILESNAGQGAWVTVGPDHAVYCFWLSGQIIKMRKSTDLGVSFGPTVNVTSIVSAGVNGDLGLGGGFRSNTFPQAVVSPTNANVIYLVHPDVGQAGGDKADVYLISSTDGGSTWGTKVKVNDDATTNDQWQPSLAITPDGTRLFVGYYTRQYDVANNLIDTQCRIGTTAGGNVAFDASQRVTDVSFPVEHGHDPTVNSVYMGDYDNASADAQFFYYSWGDNRDRNFNNTRQQNNVRFAKIPVGMGPGADTVGLYLPSSGTFFLRNSNSGGVADVSASYGAPNSVPLVGDWDGNGTDTLGIYIPATGVFFLRNSTTPGTADVIVSFGPAGAGFVPIVGDWDGNGSTTVGVYDPATSTFFLKNSNTPGTADIVVGFGAGGGGFVPLAGDWDGNGTDTIGLYLSSAATFFLRNSNTPGVADVSVNFGVAGQVPAVGDFNGDGTDTIGVYDTASSAFFLRNSNTPGVADITAVFGAPGLGFSPLIGDYDGL